MSRLCRFCRRLAGREERAFAEAHRCNHVTDVGEVVISPWAHYYRGSVPRMSKVLYWDQSIVVGERHPLRPTSISSMGGGE